MLTGGAALNAVANMRLLEKFDESYYSRVLGRRTQLHLWVPPVPGDAGATLGAAYAFAAGAIDQGFRCKSLVLWMRFDQGSSWIAFAQDRNTKILN